MSIYSHPTKSFPFDQLYKAVQKALKADDDIWAAPLAAIKKNNEPAVKKLLGEYKDQPYKMEAFFEGVGIFVRILDDKAKLVDKTKTTLVKDHATLLKASRQILAEDKARAEAAEKYVKARQIKPIPVLHKDFAKEVVEKAGKAGKFEIKRLYIDIEIKDPVILQHVPNEVSDALLAQKLHDAASLDDIRTELITAYVNASNSIKTAADVTTAEKQFEAEVKAVVTRAIQRASKQISNLVKLNVSQKSFKTETDVSLGLAIGGTILGATATAASIVTAPLHLGIATVASIAGTLQSIKSTVDLIRDARGSLQDTTKKLDEALQLIVSQYKNASETLVGAGEMGKTLVNSLVLPNSMTTINRVKTLVELVQKGLDRRELDIHRLSAQLSSLVELVHKGQKQFATFEDMNKKWLTPTLISDLTKTRRTIEKADKPIKALIDEITGNVTTITNLKKSYREVREAVATVAAGKPTWAEVGEVLIGAAAAAGFMAGGNVSSPDPFKGMENINTIAGLVGNAQGSIDVTLNTAQGLEDSIAQ